MTRMALAVAVMTFREAVRDRILYLLLAFALVMIVSGWLQKKSYLIFLYHEPLL